MSQSRSIVTGLFVLVAIVLSSAAYFVFPRVESTGMEEQLNKPLFEFDPADIRSLDIVKFDEGTSQFERLRLENSLSYGWRIPSKFNYPIDSDERLRATATSLTGLVVIRIASEDPTDEETYGVVEPTDGMKAGQKGVGIKVMFQDRAKQVLAAAIIGKADDANPRHRYIRVPGQRYIYVCEYDPGVLSTEFFDWIEPKILNLGTQWQIAGLNIKNYSANVNPRVVKTLSYEMDLNLVDDQWNLQGFVDAQDPANTQPRLDLSRIEQLRVDLGNFEITDVVKKSPALAKSLREGRGVPNTFQIVNAVKNLGFFLNDQQTPPELVAAGGELAFSTTDGIQYQIYFGGLIPANQTPKGEIDMRYVMVTAEVDESMFPMPKPPNASPPAESGNPPVPPNDCEATLQDEDDREAKRQYQIALDRRKEKLKIAGELAREVNDRFSDWFYLIDANLHRKLFPPKSSVIAR